MAIKTEHGDLKPIIYLGAIGPDGLLIVQYKVPPNPLSPGWWLPAPEIGYGEDPSEEMTKLVKDLGLTIHHQHLVGIESFVHNNAWHLIHKFRVDVSGSVSHENISDHRWITEGNMPQPTEFAHGNWEVELCRFFLAPSPALAAR